MRRLAFAIARPAAAGIIAGAMVLGAIAAVSLTSSNSNAAVRRARAATPAPAPFISRVSLGEGGSHILGNPAARVKLVEYASYTCVHCADFAAQASATLRTRYIAPGTMSFELRHTVRDPLDFAMAVAANCGPRASFFTRHEALMSAQQSFVSRATALPQATVDQWSQGTPAQRMARVARDTGVSQWMRARGLTVAQVNACLADVPLQQRLVAMTNGGRARGVASTPSFLIDNLLQGAHDWAELQPALDAAVDAGG